MSGREWLTRQEFEHLRRIKFGEVAPAEIVVSAELQQKIVYLSHHSYTDLEEYDFETRNLNRGLSGLSFRMIPIVVRN